MHKHVKWLRPPLGREGDVVSDRELIAALLSFPNLAPGESVLDL